MKKRLSALLAGASLTILAVPVSHAQDDSSPSFAPIDVWTCSFNERRDTDDLDDWVTRFNRWSDQQDEDTYSAWTLTPAYYGPNQSWDFIWVGSWSDGNAMGRGWDLWNETNDGLMNEFLAMVTCDTHSNFASVAYRIPEDMDPSGTGVLAASDCSMKEGAEGPAVNAAMRRWAGAMGEAGSAAAYFYWFPVYGGGDEQFDLKWIEVFPDWTEWGADYERMGNGGLYMQWNAEFGHLLDCDSARVYNYQSRRIANMEDDG